MLERNVEKYLCDRVTEAGGEVRKLQWIGRRAAPDRVVLLHGAHFVELKRTGGKPEPHQIREHEKMRDFGAPVWVLDSPAEVDLFLMEILRRKFRR